MKQKLCCRCKISKPSCDFSKNTSLKDELRSYCKMCQKEYDRFRYLRDKTVILTQQKNKRAISYKRNRDFIFDYLISHPCVDCGETDPVVLEFDHVRGKKSKNISALLNVNASLSSIKDEISKCDVRCANCHRRKTAIERNWWTVNWKLSDENKYSGFSHKES